jgi:hypothetical protein
MASRIMVNVSFAAETIAQIDRMRVGTPDRPEVKRAAWVAWATEQFIAAHAPAKVPQVPARHRAVARPFPLEDVRRGAEQLAGDAALRPESSAPQTEGPTVLALSEGARLGVARKWAGLSHAALGEATGTSRGMVQRAERATTLDGYPALRAWLERQEQVAKGGASA